MLIWLNIYIEILCVELTSFNRILGTSPRETIEQKSLHIIDIRADNVYLGVIYKVTLSSLFWFSTWSYLIFCKTMLSLPNGDIVEMPLAHWLLSLITILWLRVIKEFTSWQQDLCWSQISLDKLLVNKAVVSLSKCLIVICKLSLRCTL